MTAYQIIANNKPVSEWLVSRREAEKILAYIHPALHPFIRVQVAA